MKFKAAVCIESIFLLIAFIVYFLTQNPFFIFNFVYIGTGIAVGVFLISNGYLWGRNVVMLAVGSYLLFFVGIYGHENISMSGFWYYLFSGVFEAAVIHFLIAKIVGPLLFGRGWCGYACWTAMIFDLLPYKTPQNPRKSFEHVRYILFLAILSFVAGLFIFKIGNIDMIMYYTFVLGNIIYYVTGILLAFLIKDNRAFCKYVCPITVFLKISSYFSVLRVTVNKNKCVDCEKCLNVCPMDVDMLDNSRKRVNGTECILCMECVHVCKNNALDL